MILDRLPDRLASSLGIRDVNEVRLAYESTSAFDGSTGSSWLVVHRSQVHVVSALPLGDPEIVSSFTIANVSAAACSKSILGDIKLEFSFRDARAPFTFVVPSLLYHEWEVLSDILHSIFEDAFRPEIRDASLGSNTDISSSSLIAPVETMDITFKPISGVQIDDSRMQSRLDTTMGGLADQIDVHVTDENSFKISDVRSDGMPEPSDRHLPSKEQKQKKFRQTPRTNLIAPAPEPEEDQPGQITCPKCQKKNKPDYIYCLGCGQELESRKKAQRRKGGNDHSQQFGYSTSSETQTEEASGCIVQLFYFIIGVGALLFFISLGK